MNPTTRQEVFSGAVGLRWLREQIEEHLACGSVFVPFDKRALEFVPRAVVEELIEEYRRAGWTKASIVGHNIVAIDLGEYEKPEGLINLWDEAPEPPAKPAVEVHAQAADSDLVLRTPGRNMATELGPDDGPGLGAATDAWASVQGAVEIPAAPAWPPNVPPDVQARNAAFTADARAAYGKALELLAREGVALSSFTSEDTNQIVVHLPASSSAHVRIACSLFVGERIEAACKETQAPNAGLRVPAGHRIYPAAKPLPGGG